MKAAILGISGYTGRILLRLLAEHPQVKTIVPVSMSQIDKKVIDIDPGLDKQVEQKLTTTNGVCIAIQEAASMDFDVVFAALPHLKSAELLKPFFVASSPTTLATIGLVITDTLEWTMTATVLATLISRTLAMVTATTIR